MNSTEKNNVIYDVQGRKVKQYEPFWYLHCEWKEIRKEIKFNVESYEIN